MSEHVRFMNYGHEVPPYVAMTCLLVREGANWQTASMLGVDVMALCPPEMDPLIHQVARESRRYLSPPTLSLLLSRAVSPSLHYMYHIAGNFHWCKFSYIWPKSPQK